MTRYYNENPQVKHWMDKCAMLQQEIDLLSEQLEDTISEANHWEYEYDELVSEVNKRYDEWQKEIKEKRDVLKHFNSLPWYKKLFFRFKL